MSAKQGNTPRWAWYRRVGTVTAVRHREPWTWTSHGGDTMHADSGDWEVRDSDGDSWSVRDDKFRSTYRNINGNRYERTGFVRAGRARKGEIVDTLEGPVRTAAGDWVVTGSAGEQWPVPGEEFAQRYVGPVSIEDDHQIV